MKYVVALALGLSGSLVLLFVIYLFADRVDKSTHKSIRLLEADLLSKDEEVRAKAQRRMIRLKKDNITASTVANYCIYFLIIAGAALIVVCVALAALAIGNAFII